MLSELLTHTKHANKIYKPEFFRIYKPIEKAEFEKLLTKPGISVYDELYDQLKELTKSRNPKRKLTDNDYKELIARHIGNTPITEYGVWVYYPWSGRIVHLLDKEEFIELRTSANKNKITVAEQKILAGKKVGVIGLSVGQSVSLTLAMERGCGELRIADFDTLELNNLNRIRTGVHNLGLLKAYSVAREIAELDPYFKVVCYTDGITQENIHDFFTVGGKLDVVIDECDGVNIKILCRIKAKELNVPVLMEASDRGTLDVERFDLEPARPIIHGWLEHLSIDFEVLNKLKTAEEKLPYILPISGLDTLSPRMKASMVEIEQTITTWPQLATAVTLGGALTADTCRRMFLGQFTDSGRYFIDLEQLIPDTRVKPATVFDSEQGKQITDEEIQQLVHQALGKITPTGFAPTPDILKELVAAAVKAPSAGNNQPWKWHLQENCLFLFHDRARSVSFGDFEDIASFVALGAAVENMELAAYSKNIGTEITTFPAGSKKLVAVIQFKDKATNKNLYRPEALVQLIDARCTNRNLGPRKPLPEGVAQQLEAAVASVPGARLLLKTNPEDLNELADIIGSAERLRVLHPQGHYEFYEKEVRWNEEHSRSTADGIDIATVDVTPSEVVGLKLVKDPEVVKLLAEWRGGKALEKMAQKSVGSASAIGLITMPEFSSLSYFTGGRAVERIWLTATGLGISMQPLLAATLHFVRLKHSNGEGMPDFMKEEFGLLYKRFEALFPEAKDKGEIFLFRLSVTNPPAIKSYRLSLEKVLTGV
jgi:hypothetical protein